MATKSKGIPQLPKESYWATHGGAPPSRQSWWQAHESHPTPGHTVPARPGSTFPFVPKGALGKALTPGGEYAPLNVRGIQSFLRNKGYDITVDGKLGPETKQALYDAIQSGVMKNPTQADEKAIQGIKGPAMSAKAFDHMVSTAGTPPYRPLDGKGGQLTSTGNVALNGGTTPSASSGSQAVNLGPANSALKFATGKPLSQTLANFGTPFDVNQVSQAMAQEQFQPQINEQQLTVNEDPVQAAQNEKDVSDWYNQVQQAQQGAAQNDAAATKQGVDATNAATQALVASLGGSANQGSGEAAAAGQNAANTLQAIGASQSGLDQELAPILAAQAAQQKTNQANIDQNKLTTDQQALQSLQGQEGNAETSAQMQLQSANNSLDSARNQALQQILEYNNSLGQQKFQNQLGLLTSQIAAAMNGVTMAKDQAEANYYNAHGNLYNAEAANGGSSRSASQLQDIQKGIIQGLTSKGLIVPSGAGSRLAPGVTPAQVLIAARGLSSGYGSLPGGFLGGTVLGGVQGY